MGDMLGADLDEIRSLGSQLRAKGTDLARIAGPARAGVDAVVMPGAGIDDLLGRLVATLDATASKHSAAVLALADGASTSAATYEAVDEAFSRQLGSLTDGLGQ